MTDEAYAAHAAAIAAIMHRDEILLCVLASLIALQGVLIAVIAWRQWRRR